MFEQKNVIFWENSNFLDKFHCLNDDLENFRNNRNLWSILSESNLENFKLHLKVRNFNFFPYNFFKFCIFILKFHKIFNLTLINFQKVIRVYMSVQDTIVTKFNLIKGELPFRYLGVSLSSKYYLLFSVNLWWRRSLS